MKRIVVDARMVGTTGHGIGNYVLQFAQGLAARKLPFELLYLVSPLLPKDSFLRTQPHHEVNISFLHPTEALSLAREIARLEPALYHTPSFSSLSRYPVPHLQTVHDLNHRHYGSMLQKVYYRTLLLPSLKSAKRILTVSESARVEIQHWLKSHRQEREVTVMPNPISPAAKPDGADDVAVLSELGLTAGGYFLCVSNPKTHKNLALLEKAYLEAAKEAELPPLVLSVPGKDTKGIRYLSAVSDRHFGPLMRQPRAFFFPSLYEGFGRPPLEAAVEGVFPVVSDIPVHREVLAGVKETVFLPPKDRAAWKNIFLELGAPGGRPAFVSEASKNWIKQTYDLSHLVDRMQVIYDEALI